ncbi:hypothetical protein VPNG_09557 [Cytospora leucostoma]|uniref:4-hydroxy-3-methoxy-5-polyprenylbenzoate decarboxylase n=1 Tax=Cytospora leucostoma TaxID=1230097 RepID=A0A423VQD1_9PEZI|nr:hypothetical protein VPNG_09557 [Cytospora leucostoma]
MKPILPRAPALSRGSRELCKHTTIPAVAAVSTTTNTRRPFSILNRPPPNYPGHVPLTRIERAGLAIGSGLISLANPYRGDLIASFAEATSTPYFLPRLRDAMLRSPTGRRILRDRPRMTSTSLDLPHLRSLAPNTVGGTYVAWLDREGVSPDTRASVKYVDDEECAYVMQRYRECHDFYHALTGLPVVREGEVALKAFEWANTGLPMTGLATLAAFTMKEGEKRRFVDIYLPWALRNGWRCEEVINVYWEEELESDVGELRRRLGVEPPPDLRALRTKEREENRRRKREAEELKKAAASVVGGASA